MKFFCFLILPAFLFSFVRAQDLDNYNILWQEQSRNSGESMPCGGGDIGLNVWVENGDILFYMARSGTFDENNLFPKLGRVRLSLSPNPFREGTAFRQELKLRGGYVEISGTKGGHTVRIDVWVDVFRPVVHLTVNSSKPVKARASYESWRTRDRELKGREKFGTSYKWADEEVITGKDQVSFRGNGVLFYHRNSDSTVFDRSVSQQGLAPVKAALWNPLTNLTFGGLMQGRNMQPAGTVE
ncbi:MAG TPA: DUF5703 domain-containing protein, partial [Anseongella sp.]|nr:DUF5703 domain-containing protein [Anseongella sp.]